MIYRTLLAITAASVFAHTAIGESEDAPHPLPSWEAWSQILEGLPVQQLEALLGKPSEPVAPTANAVYCYGVIVPKSRAFPFPLGFYIHTANGKVVRKEQPFGDGYQLTGKPSTPRLIAPDDGIKLSHHPRYADLRWEPSSGRQPVTYYLKIEITNPGSKDWRLHGHIKTTVPYYPLIFAGSQPGRWSVRAVNADGTSEWSEIRTFDWSQQR